MELSAPVRRGPVLLAVVVGSGIVFLDGTIVNVALESIGRDLPATLVGTLEGMTYVTGGYLAVLAAFLIPAGALSDAYGRRRVFGYGLVGFGITSAACGLAPTMELLILFRLVQGAAGAFLVSGALSIITATFAGEERGRAIGLWAASTSALTTLGPLIGGLLIQAISWLAAFLVTSSPRSLRPEGLWRRRPRVSASGRARRSGTVRPAGALGAHHGAADLRGAGRGVARGAELGASLKDQIGMRVADSGRTLLACLAILVLLASCAGNESLAPTPTPTPTSHRRGGRTATPW